EKTTFIAAVDCVRAKANPKKRMAARSAAILVLGFMCLFTWRQLYNEHWWCFLKYAIANIVLS
ncbi:MAG: hypothetical protein ACK5RE_11990, partial [Pseudanabaena sp.]